MMINLLFLIFAYLFSYNQAFSVDSLRLDNDISNFVYYNESVYVSAESNLYKISSSSGKLAIDKRITLGTYVDPTKCESDEDANRCTLLYCPSTIPTYKSTIRFLSLRETNKKLIECSSLFGGTCRFRNLDDLSVYGCNYTAQMFYASAGIHAITVNDNFIFMPVLNASNQFIEPLELKLIQFYKFTELKMELNEIVENDLIVDVEFIRKQNINLKPIGSFSAKGFTYFAYSVEKSNKFKFKLLRVCGPNDWPTDSYLKSRMIEITLKCKSSNKVLTQAKQIIYHKETSTIFFLFDSQNSQDTSLCSIGIDKLNKIFFESAKPCFAFSDSSSIPYITDLNGRPKTIKCSSMNTKLALTANKNPDTSSLNESSYCTFNYPDYYDANLPLKYISVSDEYQLDNFKISSSQSINESIKRFHIFMLNENRMMIVTLSTDLSLTFYEYNQMSNELIYVMQSNISSSLNELGIKASEENIGIEFIKEKYLLYVYFGKVLFKVDLSVCSPFQTCNECSRSLNPYCGWCFSVGACMTNVSCLDENKKYGSTNYKWIDYSAASTCPIVKNISPGNYLSPKVNQKVQLYLNFDLSSDLKCFYQEINATFKKEILLSSRIDDAKNLIECELNANAIDFLDNLDNEGEFIDFSLSLKSSVTNSTIVSTEKIRFVNCIYLKDCKECTKYGTSFCEWDIRKSKCKIASVGVAINTDQTQICLSVTTKGIYNLNYFYKKSESVSRGIEFEISELNKIDSQLIDQIKFVCSFNGTYKVDAIPAYFSNKFSCNYEPMNDNRLQNNISVQTLKIKVFYYFEDGIYHSISQSDFLVNVINCEKYASNCGECLVNVLSDIQCGWCKSSGVCTLNGKCDQSSWLAKGISGSYSLCPSPILKKVSPVCGPISGGTLLEMSGENLGHDASQISVKLVNENVINNCQVVSEKYVKSSKIVCNTSYMSDQSVVDIQIKFTNNDETVDLINNNEFKFRYENIDVYSISPQKSIKSGGTEIKLSGKNFNCGYMKEISFGDSPCQIIASQNSSDSNIFCRTSKGTNLTNLKIKIDNFEKVFDDIYLDYVADPRINSINIQKTIMSGGINLIAYGESFDLINKANVVIRELVNNGKNYSNPCEIEANLNLISCLTPSIDSKVNDNAAFLLYLTFNDIINTQSNQTIQLFEDPLFDDMISYKKDESDFIQFKGERFDVVNKEEYSIMIGDSISCLIYRIEAHSISCKIIMFNKYLELKSISSQKNIITKQILISKNETENAFAINVFIGKYFNKTIGYAYFEEFIIVIQPDSPKNVIFISLTVLVSVVSFLSLIIYSKIRAMKNENKKIKEQNKYNEIIIKRLVTIEYMRR